MDADDPARLTRIRLLHERLISGEAGVWGFEEAFNLFHPVLVRRLSARRRLRGVDPHVIEDGVVDATREYVTRPGTFDPARGRPLQRHLELAAARNVSNLRRGEARRHRREREAAADRPRASVELQSAAGIALQNEAAERKTRERQQLMELFADRKDRQVVALQLAAVRRTAAFAEVLGVGHLPPEEQRVEVKRAKDRIGKVMRRAARPKRPPKPPKPPKP